MKQLMLCLALCAVLVGCEKEDEGNPPFIGITEKDDANNPIGNADPTDWTFDEVWDSRTKGLFYDIAGLNYNCGKKDSTLTTTGGYPNPATVFMRIDFNYNSNYIIDLRIVNRDYDVLLAVDSSATNKVLIDVDLDPTGDDEIYRVYYRLWNQDCAYTGHGDFKVM